MVGHHLFTAYSRHSDRYVDISADITIKSQSIYRSIVGRGVDRYIDSVLPTVRRPQQNRSHPRSVTERMQDNIDATSHYTVPTKLRGSMQICL